jgi:NADH dehydrogenase FAD-containing subunit
MKRIAIIGGGYAGLKALATLAFPTDLRITVIPTAFSRQKVTIPSPAGSLSMRPS